MVCFDVSPFPCKGLFSVEPAVSWRGGVPALSFLEASPLYLWVINQGQPSFELDPFFWFLFIFFAENSSIESMIFLWNTGWNVSGVTVRSMRFANPSTMFVSPVLHQILLKQNKTLVEGVKILLKPIGIAEKYYYMLGGGFKDCLFSPLLGATNPIWPICFKLAETTNATRYPQFVGKKSPHINCSPGGFGYGSGRRRRGGQRHRGGGSAAASTTIINHHHQSL